MFRPLAPIILMAMLCNAPVQAQDARFADVVDASVAWPDGERMIVVSVIIPASRAEVWAALSTEAGWVAHMGVAQARIDLRPGGAIETSYKPSSETGLGTRDTIINRVEAVAPETLLVIRNVQAPVDFQYAEEYSRTRTVILLDPAEGGTRVTLRGEGFLPGAAYDSLYARFRMGNAYTLQNLRDSFIRPR